MRISKPQENTTDNREVEQADESITYGDNADNSLLSTLGHSGNESIQTTISIDKTLEKIGFDQNQTYDVPKDPSIAAKIAVDSFIKEAKEKNKRNNSVEENDTSTCKSDKTETIETIRTTKLEAKKEITEEKPNNIISKEQNQAFESPDDLMNEFEICWDDSDSEEINTQENNAIPSTHVQQTEQVSMKTIDNNLIEKEQNHQSNEKEQTQIDNKKSKNVIGWTSSKKTKTLKIDRSKDKVITVKTNKIRTTDSIFPKEFSEAPVLDFQEETKELNIAPLIPSEQEEAFGSFGFSYDNPIAESIEAVPHISIEKEEAINYETSSENANVNRDIEHSQDTLHNTLTPELVNNDEYYFAGYSQDSMERFALSDSANALRNLKKTINEAKQKEKKENQADKKEKAKKTENQNQEENNQNKTSMKKLVESDTADKLTETQNNPIHNTVDVTIPAGQKTVQETQNTKERANSSDIVKKTPTIPISIHKPIAKSSLTIIPAATESAENKNSENEQNTQKTENIQNTQNTHSTESIERTQNIPSAKQTMIQETPTKITTPTTQMQTTTNQDDSIIIENQETFYRSKPETIIYDSDYTEKKTSRKSTSKRKELTPQERELTKDSIIKLLLITNVLLVGIIFFATAYMVCSSGVLFKDNPGSSLKSSPTKTMSSTSNIEQDNLSGSDTIAQTSSQADPMTSTPEEPNKTNIVSQDENTEIPIEQNANLEDSVIRQHPEVMTQLTEEVSQIGVYADQIYDAGQIQQESEQQTPTDPSLSDVVPGTSTPMTEEERTLSYKIFNRYNEWREEQGLTQVVWSEDCAKMAYNSAARCSEQQQLIHNLGIPDNLRGQYSDILQYANWGITGYDAVRFWEASDGHRAMMKCRTTTKAAVAAIRVDYMWYLAIVYDYVDTNFSE